MEVKGFDKEFVIVVWYLLLKQPRMLIFLMPPRHYASATRTASALGLPNLAIAAGV